MVIGDALSLWDRGEVLIVLEYLLKRSRSDLLLSQKEEVPGPVLTRLEEMIEERKTGRPLQYILGTWPFYDFEVKVRDGVLIPRPETELLVEEALAYLKPGMRALDIGTGSGVIAFALAKNGAHVTAVDINTQALDLARENAQDLGLDIDFVLSDTYENVQGKFDLIVSNPPYIREDERESLARELDFEDPRALFSGEDGLDVIRKILEGARDHLKPGGLLAIEIGYDQGGALKSLFKDFGFRDIIIKKDYNDYDRIGRGFLCY